LWLLVFEVRLAPLSNLALRVVGNELSKVNYNRVPLAITSYDPLNSRKSEMFIIIIKVFHKVGSQGLRGIGAFVIVYNPI
jgi:hypothetical protein